VREKKTFRTAEKFEDYALQELHNENPAQTLLELSKVLNITSKAVKIHKEGIWLLHELS